MDTRVLVPDAYSGPGLVDLQVNGYKGFDFNSPAESWRPIRLDAVRAALRQRGVLAALPTLITDDAERMIARARKYAEFVGEDDQLARAFPKLHIEGPFIATEDGPRGAHPRAFCRTPRDLPDFLAQLRDASGDRIGIWTMAPEVPGVLGLIERASACGIRVATGHTGATSSTIREAVTAGARMSTHLGNGSHQTLPRLDNYVQAQLADDRLMASFIADGHHIPFTTLKNFLRAKTLERSILVTDAIAAADVGPGRYNLGGEEIVVTAELRVSKPGQPNLAGSALTLDCAIINTCVHCGIAFPDVWAMASTIPAALIGIEPPETIQVQVNKDGFRTH